MTHVGHELPQHLFKIITSAVNVFLLIVLFYILQYIFDIDFVCSCKGGLVPNGVLYIVFPPLIFTLLVRITEPFRKTKIFPSWRCFRSSCKNNSCMYGCNSVLRLLISYLSLGAVWISIVLFDGDWYVCLLTNLNKNYTGIPCKKDLTYEEQRIKDGYRTQSLDIGLGVISSFLLVWNFFEFCGNCWMKRCRFNLCLPYYKVIYYDHLEKEMETHVNNSIKNMAEQRVKAICAPHLQALEKKELSDGNRDDGRDETDETVSKEWWAISAPDLHLTEPTDTDWQTLREVMAR